MAASRRRTILATLLALLLLGMQHEAQVHALQHFGESLQRSHELGLQAPAADAACLECALLAGGSNAMPSSVAALPPPAVATEHASKAFASHAVAAPSYYSSRAPPSLL